MRKSAITLSGSMSSAATSHAVRRTSKCSGSAALPSLLFSHRIFCFRGDLPRHGLMPFLQ